MKIAKSCVCCGGTNLARSPAILMPFVAHRAFGWQPVEVTPEWGLRTLKPGHAHAVCNSLRCGDCGLVFLDMRFDDEEMAAIYDHYRGEEYTALRDRYEPGYRKVNDEVSGLLSYIPDIEKFLAPHLSLPCSILDWGGDTGQNTPFSANNTCLHIYDISNKPVLPGALAVGADVATSTHYDLVVCANVLEHVPYPLDLLGEVRKSMRPDTVLYIEVPFEEIIRTTADQTGLERKKKHWHEHINFYTRAALERLLARAGMVMVDYLALNVADGHHACYQLAACKLA